MREEENEEWFKELESNANKTWIRDLAEDGLYFLKLIINREFPLFMNEKLKEKGFTVTVNMKEKFKFLEYFTKEELKGLFKEFFFERITLHVEDLLGSDLRKAVKEQYDSLIKKFFT